MRKIVLEGVREIAKMNKELGGGLIFNFYFVVIKYYGQVSFFRYFTSNNWCIHRYKCYYSPNFLKACLGCTVAVPGKLCSSRQALGIHCGCQVPGHQSCFFRELSLSEMSSVSKVQNGRKLTPSMGGSHQLGENEG